MLYGRRGVSLAFMRVILRLSAGRRITAILFAATALSTPSLHICCIFLRTSQLLFGVFAVLPVYGGRPILLSSYFYGSEEFFSCDGRSFDKHKAVSGDIADTNGALNCKISVKLYILYVDVCRHIFCFIF